MLTLVLFDMYEVLRWGWLYIINKIKRAKEMNSQQMNMHHLQYANLVIKLQFQRNERNNEIPTYWMCIIQQWNCLLFFKFFFLFFFFWGKRKRMKRKSSFYIILGNKKHYILGFVFVSLFLIICTNLHAFPEEPNRRIFSATTAFMASFADAIRWIRSLLGLLSESM